MFHLPDFYRINLFMSPHLFLNTWANENSDISARKTDKQAGFVWHSSDFEDLKKSSPKVNQKQRDTIFPFIDDIEASPDSSASCWNNFFCGKRLTIVQRFWSLTHFCIGLYSNQLPEII